MSADVVLDVTTPSHVADARRAVTDLLVAQDAGDDVVDNARLAVSEVVTNALLHGEEPVTFRASASRQLLRIEVSDASAASGAPQPASATAVSGRGLAIVDTLAARWGVQARGSGKTVWLELALHEPVAQPTECVRLLSVPVALYIEAQEQLENALHEILLLEFQREGDGGLDAAASEVVSRLRDAMSVFEAARTEGRASTEAARSAGVDVVDLAWHLPAAAADAALVWAEGVAAVADLADRGVLLTPPPRAEIRRLREWIVREVRSQLTHARSAEPFALGPLDHAATGS